MLELRTDKKASNLRIFLYVTAFLFGGLTVALGELFVAPMIAFFAAVYLFDKEKHVVSIVLTLGIAAIAVLFLGLRALPTLVAFLGAILLASLTFKRRPKAESVFVMTAFFVLYFLFSFWLATGEVTHTYRLGEQIDEWSATIESLVSLIVDQIVVLGEAYVMDNPAYEAIFNEETLRTALDLILYHLPAFIACASLLLVFISEKILSLVLSGVAKDAEVFRANRFRVSNLYVTVYIILFLISPFMTALKPFALSVSNLYLVFLLVFAYLGAYFFIHVLMRKNKTVFPYLIVLVAVVLFAPFILPILSILGAYFALIDNSAARKFKQ